MTLFSHPSLSLSLSLSVFNRPGRQRSASARPDHLSPSLSVSFTCLSLSLFYRLSLFFSLSLSLYLSLFLLNPHDLNGVRVLAGSLLHRVACQHRCRLPLSLSFLLSASLLLVLLLPSNTHTVLFSLSLSLALCLSRSHFSLLSCASGAGSTWHGYGQT